jgi:hypothetical protein
MTKLKIAKVTDDKPVTITVKLPAAVHRDLLIYAQALQQEGGRIEATSLVAPMLARFMAADRAFRRLRRQSLQANTG